VLTLGLAFSQVAVQAAPTRVVPKGEKFSPTVTSVVTSGRGDQAGVQDSKTPSKFECRASGNPSANVLLDCDGLSPNNEPNIAVDPTDPNHMVASSNDYESCCDQWYTTFNGGATWQTGDISVEAPGKKRRTGSDPVTTFDVKHGVVIHSSLNFQNDGCDGDVVVSISRDGGIHWNTVVEVADGGGPTSCESNGLFNDKDWITTDNNPASPFYGRTYVTWTAFTTINGVTTQSPIAESHSDDGGLTWSSPQVISGSNAALCTFQADGPAGACDEDQFSVPTVAPNGNVYVSFINDQNTALWEPGEVFDDQYLVVRSTNGGRTWSSPTMMACLEDGSRDFPRNVDGRQTLTNYQVRAPITANVVADPTHNGRLYFAFFDNRNGIHDVDNPVTNTDVFLVTSTNGGAGWSAPTQVNEPDSGAGNDQWFPFVAVDPSTGIVGVVYNDRSYDPTHNTYGATLSESPAGGSSFTSQQVSTAASHARESVFFDAGTDAPGCETCALFNGDYIGLAYGSDGKANVTWTDMRDLYAPLGLYLQFIYFARR
jgi:Neuraminidase (sialidase)